MADHGGRAAPAFSTALGFARGHLPLTHGRADVAALVDAAAETGLSAPGGDEAARMLDAAATHATPADLDVLDPQVAAALLGLGAPVGLHAGCEIEIAMPTPAARALTARISFDLRRLESAARAAVRPGGWVGSRFEAAFGPMPASVAVRVVAMEERPAIAAVLSATAADALLLEARRLALALPDSMGTDWGVEWNCRTGSTQGALDWLTAEGPSRLVTGVRIEPAPDGSPPAVRGVVGSDDGRRVTGGAHEGRFTLVTPPGLAASLGGDPLFGACVVEGDVATVSFHETEAGALMAAAGTSVVPSRDPGDPTVVAAEAEFEAIAHVADAVVSRRIVAGSSADGSSPRGFERRPAPSEGGLALRAGDYGVDLLVGHALAESLGWAPGTRVDLSLDPGATRMAIHPCPDGATLSESSAPSGHPALEPDRTLPGVPRWLLRQIPSDWCMAPHAIDGGHLVIEVRDLVDVPPAMQDEEPDVPPHPAARILRSRAIPRLTVGIAVAAALLALWGVGNLLVAPSPPTDMLPLSLGESVMPTPPGLGEVPDPL